MSAPSLSPSPVRTDKEVLREVTLANSPKLQQLAGILSGLYTAAGREEQRKERAAFLSLARREHQLSWIYRKWALEEEKAGNLDAYRKYAREARRLWRAAKSAIDHARRREA